MRDVTETAPTNTALRICPFCEATCGLTLTIDDGRVVGAKGDHEDVFSAGYICPKGASFAELDNDPDRLSAPLVRRDGTLTEATWAEAFDAVAKGLGAVIGEHGGTSVGVYLGNPNAHTIAGALYPPLIIRGLGTHHVYSASTLDQMPKHVAVGLMFGSPVAFPVPDLDRTDYLVVIGANPLVSNGSLATVANFGGKLRKLRKRGGKLVVIDPAKTRTAALADRHLAPRPGTDAALLFGVVHVLFDEGLVDLGVLADYVAGLQEVRDLARDFPPEAVAEHCGIEADEIRALARELAGVPAAAVYGRMGTSTVEFGTLGSWLVDVVNVLTGNLDRAGGAMFPLSPVAPAPRGRRKGRGFRTGRWHSRVSGHPEVLSEQPTAALAEEIETPGDGQIKAMITIAGNPVLSAPDGDRLDRALGGGSLDFMLSIDPYLNETTRHADVILPPPPPSRSPHFDFAFNNLAVRNNARYSPPALALHSGPDEAEILSRIILVLYGIGVDADPALVDEQVIGTTLAKEAADVASPVSGRATDELTAMLDDGPGYERRIDMMLRLGAYGDGFGIRPDGLTLKRLKAAPHGIDLGPMQPRLPDLLRTASGLIELAPPPLVADAARLRDSLGQRDDGFVLIGRRHLRSNNSWMHNVAALAGGTNRCTLRIHPDDAAELGVSDTAVVKGPGGELVVPVEITEEIRRGVLSLPHGWGHDRRGTGQTLASRHPGANVNQLNDGSVLDPLSGTAVLNGIPVVVEPAVSPR